MRLAVAIALTALSASAAHGAPRATYSATPSSSTYTSIQFAAGDTSPSPLVPAIGSCVAMFSRAGTDVVTLYQTTAGTATGGTQVGDTFSATTTEKRRLIIGQPNLYAVSNGATGGSVLTIECSAVQIAGASVATQTIPTTGDPWVSCAGLPDPGHTPVSVTSAQDLHEVVIDECATGCTLELAYGTYTDSNVTMGPLSDARIKADSLTAATGEIIIRAADPENRPTLRAEIGNPAAIFYLVNIAARVRLSDLILDGRKSEQTNAIFIDDSGVSSICADTSPADGECDSGTQTFSVAGGFNSRATDATVPMACLDNVDIMNTVADAVFIRNAAASTVQNSTITGAGCTDSSCPAISLPDDESTNSVTVVGRGVNLVDSAMVAVADSAITDVTKQGAQCYGSTQCYVADNTITDVGNVGVTMLGSSGNVWRNTISGAGILYPPNTTDTSTGNGLSFVDTVVYSTDITVDVTGNSVSNTHGASYLFGLSTADESVVITLTDNESTDACLTSTRSGEAAYLLGDSTDNFQSITATGNTATGNRCPSAFSVRNALIYTADDNVVTGSSGADYSVSYDDVEDLDDDGLIVDADINIDADSVGTLTNCTLNSGATIVGDLEGGVVRTNCGPAHTGGSSKWGEMEWGTDVWG